MLKRSNSSRWMLLLLLVTNHAIGAACKSAPDAGSIEPPIRSVLVFDPGLLDNMDALGVEPDGVPSDNWMGTLKKYGANHYARIGSLFEPDYETVDRLHPGLILLADRSRSKCTALSRIAPTVDLTVDPIDLVGGAIRNARVIGTLFGREAIASQRIDHLLRSIDRLRVTAATRGRALILMTSGGRVTAYGPGSRFGVLHDSFGFVPAAPDLDVALHGQSVSYEYMARIRPDWIFVIDRDASIGAEGAAAARLLDNALVHLTPAWQNERIVYLDSDDWYMIGLTGIGALQRSVDKLMLRLSTTHD